jgi:hypothetical protein
LRAAIALVGAAEQLADQEVAVGGGEEVAPAGVEEALGGQPAVAVVADRDVFPGRGVIDDEPVAPLLAALAALPDVRLLDGGVESAAGPTVDGAALLELRAERARRRSWRS